jgi:hypothetical protein
MFDITLGETRDFKFTTCEPDTGAPATLSGTPVISAYVDNSTTQITAGITLTVDFDGVTGLNNVRVVATSGNGFATGTNVALIITTGTVDSVSAVGYKVAEFSIGRAAAFTRLGAPAGASVSADIAAIEAQTDDIGAAGAGLTAIPWNSAWDAEVQSEVADALGVYDPPTNAELVSEINAVQADIAALNNLSAAQVNAEVDSAIETYRLDEIVAAAAAAPAAGSFLADVLEDNAGTFRFTEAALAQAPSGGGGGDATEAKQDTIIAALAVVDGNVDSILADTNELQGDWANGGRLDLILDARASQASVDTIDDLLDTEIGALTTAVADLPTNAELATALGTADDAVLAAVATVDSNVDAIKAKTDSLTFTVANVLDANIQRINDVAITGDGQIGTEFGV